jgi:hypothetical protein
MAVAWGRERLGGDVDVGGGVTGDWESNREIPRG